MQRAVAARSDLALTDADARDIVEHFERGYRPARPWLGLYATEDEKGVIASSMARGGPALSRAARRSRSARAGRKWSGWIRRRAAPFTHAARLPWTGAG